MRRFVLLVGAALTLTLLAATAAFAKDGQGKPDTPAGDAPASHGHAYGHDKHNADGGSDEGAEGEPGLPANAPDESEAKDATGDDDAGKGSEKGGRQSGGGKENDGPVDKDGHGGDDPEGKSGDAKHHVIVCHRTGSSKNPYVVINISVRGWEHGHTTHPELDGRGDIVLKDPARPGEKLDASRCETGDDDDGGGGGGDDGGGGGGDDGGGDDDGVGGNGGDNGGGGHEGGGPGGNAQDGRPAVTTSSDLPFTGVPTLSFLLIGLALLGGGLALRKVGV